MPTTKTKKKKAWRFPNGETVREAMERQGMNARQLSLAVKCSPQSACHWRDGRQPHRHMVPAIARALGLPIEVTP